MLERLRTLNYRWIATVVGIGLVSLGAGFALGVWLGS